MKFQQLHDHAHAGQVDELNLISIEGGIYLLEVRSLGNRALLHDAKGATLHLRSVEHARQLLETLPELPFHLLHASAHDEMCGLGAPAGEPLKVPLAFRSQW